MRIALESITRSRWPAIAALILLAASLSCKEEPAGPALAQESSGDGTLTLKVVAEAEGHDTAVNSYETVFTATVSDTLGAPVSGATVTIVAAFGTLVLQEDVAGTYRAVFGGYRVGSYTLDVARGADRVTGVTVMAPAIHTVTKPAANDSVTADTAFNVRWTRPDTADETRLETRDYSSDWYYGDQGTSWIPSVGNPPRTDQRLRVYRRNVQIAARGLPGSQLSVSIRRTVEPIVAE
jgi:hypothetical protein